MRYLEIKTIKEKIISVLAVVLSAGILTVQAQEMSAIELLDRCAKSQGAFVKQISKSETIIESTNSTDEDGPKWYKDVTEVKYDGQRYDIIKSSWNYVDGKDAPTPPEEAFNARQLYDGEVVYDGWRFKTGNILDIVGNIITMTREGRNFNRNIAYDYGTPLLGIFTGDLRPAVEILRESEQVHVRGEMEVVGGSPCYVLDAEGENGRYTVWIDPEHGYNIAKSRVRKTGDNIAYGEKMGIKKAPKPGIKPETPRYELTDFTFEVDNVRFEKIDDVWVPVEGDFRLEHEYEDSDGNKQVTVDNRHNRRTHIEINPDFEAMGAFKANIPEGTKVAIQGIRGVKYVWQSGELIPDIDKFKVELLENFAEQLRPNLSPAIASSLPLTVPEESSSGVYSTTGVNRQNAHAENYPLLTRSFLGRISATAWLIIVFCLGNAILIGQTVIRRLKTKDNFII